MTNSIENTKKCSKCGEVKVMSDYGKRAANSDGHEGRCKVCIYKASLKSRNSAQGKAVKAASDKKYRESNNGKAVIAAARAAHVDTEATIANKKAYGKGKVAKESCRRYNASAAGKASVKASRAKESAKALRAAAHARRRALKLAATDVNMSDEEKAQIAAVYVERDRLNVKAGCIAHHVDHIVALANGGQHTISNLQILGASENMSKGAR